MNKSALLCLLCMCVASGYGLYAHVTVDQESRFEWDDVSVRLPDHEEQDDDDRDDAAEESAPQETLTPTEEDHTSEEGGAAIEEHEEDILSSEDAPEPTHDVSIDFSQQEGADEYEAETPSPAEENQFQEAAPEETPESTPQEPEVEEMSNVSEDAADVEAAPQSSSQEYEELENDTELFPVDSNAFTPAPPVTLMDRLSWYTYLATVFAADGVVRVWHKIKHAGSEVRRECDDLVDYIRSEYTHAHRYLTLREKRFATLRAIGRTVWEVGVADVVDALRYESFSAKEWNFLLGVIGGNIVCEEGMAWKRGKSASHLQEATVGALALYLALIRHNAQEDKQYRHDDDKMNYLTLSAGDLRLLAQRMFSAPDADATNFSPEYFIADGE